MTEQLSNADWLATAGPNGQQVLDMIARSLETGNRELDFTQFGLPSLPPAVLIEGGWKLLGLSANPGIDLALLPKLERLELLAAGYCEIESFGLDVPAGLQRVSFNKNRLDHWPVGVAAAASTLVRLDLASNQLTEVPDDVGELTALQDLPLNGNQITRVSPAIGTLGSLKKLALHDNRDLSTLPVEILDLNDDCRVVLWATALPKSFHDAKTIGAVRQVWSDLG